MEIGVSVSQVQEPVANDGSDGFSHLSQKIRQRLETIIVREKEALEKEKNKQNPNLRRVVKQPLGQVREHVVHVFPTAVLDNGTCGLDDGHSHPGVLVSDGQHQRFDQTVSLHVEVLWP